MRAARLNDSAVFIRDLQAVLRNHRDVHDRRVGDWIHSHRSDQGAVLERSGERLGFRADHGSNHAHGRQPENHGQIRHLFEVAHDRLTRNSGNGSCGRRNVLVLEQLTAPSSPADRSSVDIRRQLVRDRHVIDGGRRSNSAWCLSLSRAPNCQAKERSIR